LFGRWVHRIGFSHKETAKTWISNLVRTTRFCDNLHQVSSKSKYLKAKQFNVLGAIQPKGLYRLAKNRLKSPMPEGGEP